MDMTGAVVARLEGLIAGGKLDAEQQAKAVDELHRVRRRVVKPRDTSRDNEPITVGVAK